MYGTQSVSYFSKLETIDRPYQFSKFGEKQLKKKKADFIDTNSKSNIDKLNREISDVHKIMTENISLILDRERSLQSVQKISEDIKKQSSEFKNKAYQTRMKLLLSKYSMFIALGVIAILFVVFKFYF